MNKETLMYAAKKAAEHSYHPYSGFSVGAALLGKSGKVYPGTNIENASFGATCCAERVALFGAIAAGEREFSAIAVTAMPCGICRQALSEFAPGLTVYVEENGAIREFTLGELFPHSFTLDKETKK